ncbi:MAG TPA: hypothetical protein DCQ93_09780 [Bacteroidetes bacterium]|nr:hypothetical protein [Bacteroidota bacterium]
MNKKIIALVQALMIMLLIGASLFFVFTPPLNSIYFKPNTLRIVGILMFSYSLIRAYRVYRQYNSK